MLTVFNWTQILRYGYQGMSAMDDSDREIRIKRDIEEVWGLIDNPEWFTQIFAGPTMVTNASQAQVEIKQQVGSKWFSSSIIVEYRDSDRKKIKYRIGTALIEISLKDTEDSGTYLELTLEYDLSPPELVLNKVRRSLLLRLKQTFEA